MATLPWNLECVVLNHSISLDFSLHKTIKTIDQCFNVGFKGNTAAPQRDPLTVETLKFLLKTCFTCTKNNWFRQSYVINMILSSHYRFLSQLNCYRASSKFQTDFRHFFCYFRQKYSFRSCLNIKRSFYSSTQLNIIRTKLVWYQSKKCHIKFWQNCVG